MLIILSTQVLCKLVAAGANIDMASHNGCTALIYSANYGHENATKVLIELGANLQHVTAKQSR
jgi:ankyrin repeat protein